MQVFYLYNGRTQQTIRNNISTECVSHHILYEQIRKAYTTRKYGQRHRRIALSYGIKISPVGSLDYSKSTRVTDGQTDRQNYDSRDRASIAASRGKMGNLSRG